MEEEVLVPPRQISYCPLTTCIQPYTSTLLLHPLVHLVYMVGTQPHTLPPTFILVIRPMQGI